MAERFLRSYCLGHLLNDLAEVLRRVLPADIELLVFADEDLPEVSADGHAIEQILLNLVNNARDAMPTGGVLRLETSCTWISDGQREVLGPGSTSEYVCLAVDDTGMGMDEATRQRAFEPFFTTKPVGKGTGLGLATVYGLVKQHGGFVQIDSAAGAGTRLRIYFPVAEEATRRRASGAHEQMSLPADGGKETVLVVEDQAQLRRATVHTLEHAGYTVLAAGDGMEALNLLRQHPAPIHLVFTDLVGAPGRPRPLSDRPSRGTPDAISLYQRLRRRGAGRRTARSGVTLLAETVDERRFVGARPQGSGSSQTLI